MNEMDVLLWNMLRPFLPILIFLGLLVLALVVFELLDTSSEPLHDRINDVEKDPEIPQEPEEDCSLNGSIDITQNHTTINHIMVNNITNIEVREDLDREH